MIRRSAEAEPVRGEMRETRLPGGIHVLTESIPSVRSASVGVWVPQGSAHEPEGLEGTSHLLEHMVFKGTERRTPREIALSLERLGGSLDAYTSREHTAFQARVLSEHLPLALDVLADLVLNPLLTEDALELEREVVLEEIAMVEDTPDDLVFELHGESLWGGHPYGRSILGTRASVADTEAWTLRQLHDERYRNGQLVIAAAGLLDHDWFVEAVSRQFGEVVRHDPPTVPPVAAEAPGLDVRVSREGSQTHLVFGARTPPRADPARFPLILLSQAFGGGMGSRLFQKIREELALAYTVYSFQSFHSKAGTAGVYVGTRPEWADRAFEALKEEHETLSREGLGETELREVKDQVKGQVMLSLESTSARLHRLANFALCNEPYLSLDQLLEAIEGVTGEGVAEVAARVFHPERQTVLRLGPATD